MQISPIFGPGASTIRFQHSHSLSTMKIQPVEFDLRRRSPCESDRFFRTDRKSPAKYDDFGNLPTDGSAFSGAKSPKAGSRPVPLIVAKVLDAPEVIDDFPTQLIDFSTRNQLAVALGTAVYIWDDGQVSQLMESDQLITGVCWTDRGLVISACGEVELWDAVKETIIHPLPNHEGRCCSLAFRGHRLATGGADSVINVSDLRAKTGSSLVGHHGEIAGLSWSQNCAHLASGGCDNRVMIWGDQRKRTYTFGEPIQAVNYVNPSLLAIGVMDPHGTMTFVHGRQDELPVSVATGAPITGIAFSDPWGLVVSHRKSFEWEIWSSDLKRIAKYPGHSGDILNIAVSGDGSLAATIGVDETLQLWEFRNGKAKTPGMSKKMAKSMSAAFPLR